MATRSLISLCVALSAVINAVSGQNCYFGPGATFRGPSNLMACNSSAEISACCLAGDTCLSGNACYNYASGNTYQYGCTDITYNDASCPKKCGWDPLKSPWVGLQYCSDIQDLTNTWTCTAPESCGCEWNSTYALQILPQRGCKAMGSEARVAMSAPSTLLAYVSLPATSGGSTGYYSQATASDGSLFVISTAIAGYTPDPFTQFTTYRALAEATIVIDPDATPSPATLAPAYIYTATTPGAPRPTFTGATSIPPTTSPASVSASASATSNAATSMNGPSSTTSSALSATTTATAGGLSTGAKAGIGAGVGGMALAALVGIAWFFTSRRKRRNVKSELQTSPPPPPQYAAASPMAPYLHSQPPQGWVQYPPGGMPYYLPPGTHKDSALVSMHSTSPSYSPPASPPPPTELSGDGSQTLYRAEADSIHSGASPRLRESSFSEVGLSGSPRYM